MSSRLARAGIERIVINLAWLGSQIRDYLGDGARYGVAIIYSEEAAARARDRRRNIRALPQLAPGPFAVVNGDIYTDFPFETLAVAADRDAHLVLVPNPPSICEGTLDWSDGNGAAPRPRAGTHFPGLPSIDARFSRAARTARFP